MYIKKLIGEKCYLSPMDVEDAERYALWLNDSEVTNYLQLATEVISIEEEKAKDLYKDLEKALSNTVCGKPCIIGRVVERKERNKPFLIVENSINF